MDDECFWLTYPCYVFANNCSESLDGVAILDENIQVIAPEMGFDGERQVAIFTDVYLAIDFYEKCVTRAGIRRLELKGPKALRKFLTHGWQFDKAVVDLNPQTGAGRTMLIRDMVRDIDRHLAEQGNQSDQ
jgi:hypothetical protein